MNIYFGKQKTMKTEAYLAARFYKELYISHYLSSRNTITEDATSPKGEEVAL